MPKTIQQTVRFAAPPEELFDSYLDPAPSTASCPAGSSRSSRGV